MYIVYVLRAAPEVRVLRAPKSTTVADRGGKKRDVFENVPRNPSGLGRPVSSRRTLICCRAPRGVSRSAATMDR